MIRITGVMDQLIYDDKIRNYKINKKILNVEPIDKTTQYKNYKQSNHHKTNQNNNNFTKILKKKIK